MLFKSIEIQKLGLNVTKKIASFLKIFITVEKLTVIPKKKQT
jgi:hypothetical protein